MYIHVQLPDTDATFKTVILSSKRNTTEKINLYKPVDDKVYFSELKVSELPHSAKLLLRWTAWV